MPLSTKQMEYLALAWQCFDTEPKQIDYNKFATVACLASANSARELMRVTKNKLRAEYGALGADVRGSNAGKKTPSKSASGGGAKKNSASAASEAGTPTPTPMSTSKTAGRKRAARNEDPSQEIVFEESPGKKWKGLVKQERECDGEGSDDGWQ
ncbi:hypothetical protein LTR62_002528 [Meristemomyces frigidus]|uniref:Uncharacterized protein n=1 Tax=Meristemomyces frigidus TaxID=1508187 RepID=A0AAN7TLY4_9PEZI|nr:hypothetical protein LTR62_002528 [Meristemomyces frigidus]